MRNNKNYLQKFRLILLLAFISMVTYPIAREIINSPRFGGNLENRVVPLHGGSLLSGQSGASTTGSVSLDGENPTSVSVALANGLLAIAPPPFSPEIFPCSECHDADPEADTTPTSDLNHDDIVLNHDSDNIWCYSCHTTADYDVLHLTSGEPVPFTESYRLCGQCHGTQLRDWKAGDHGKRTGSWSGIKEYLLCAHCHSPHSPQIEAIEPLAPPIRQEDIQ